MPSFADVIPARSDLDWCWYLRKQGRVGERLERVLHDIGVLYPGGWADWQHSTLTDTGAPIEMQFSADRAALSLCTEVDNPSRDPSERMNKVCGIARTLGAGTLPTALRDVISAAQGVADLRFGGWLGLRICETQLKCTLYAELPAEAADLTGLMIAPAVTQGLAAMGRDIRLRMLAYDCASGQVTLYGDADLAMSDAVPALAGIAGVAADPLLRTIAQMMDVAQSKPGTLGFSIATQNDDAAPLLSLQFLAKDVFASDDVIEPLIRDYPGDHHHAYASLVDMLSPAPDGRLHHGQIGLQARGDASPLLSVGVAAPWHCTATPL